MCLRNGMKFLGLLFILIGIECCFAQPTLDVNIPVDDIINRVDQNYSAIETIRGQLKSTSNSELKSLESLGRFYIQGQAKYHIHYIKPYDQQFISNGDTLWIYTPKDKSVIQIDISQASPFDQIIVNSLATFDVNPFNSLRKGFSFELADTLAGSYIVKAVPVTPSGLVSQVLVKVDPGKWVVLAREIFDMSLTLVSQTLYSNFGQFDRSIWFPRRIEARSVVNGKVVLQKIDFKRIKINLPIDAAKFKFKIPEGVDVKSNYDG